MDRESNAPTSKGLLWGSYVITALPVLLLIQRIGQVFQTRWNGGQHHTSRLANGSNGRRGILELVCTALYLIPRTAIFGAILLTAYLGVATAAHVRIGDPFFIPVVVGALLWLGLYLRDPRLRSLVPIRN